MGFIGAGRVAELHAEALTRTGEVEIVAIADPRSGAASRLASRFGATACDDYKDLLARSDVEAVDVMVPHVLHAEIAARTVRAGKHLFMDKPLATTVEAGRQLLKVVESTDRVVMICHNLLFHPAVLRASELVSEGLLGEPRLGHAWSTGWIDLLPWDFRRSKTATGGGAWIDNGPHLIYVLEELVGPIDSIVAAPGQGPSRLEAEDSCAALCAFHNGVVGTINISYAVRAEGAAEPWPAGWHEGVRLEGAAGSLEVHVLPTAEVRWFGERGQGEWAPDDVTFVDSFAGALQEFLAAIKEERAPRVGARDALHCLELTLGALKPGGFSVVESPLCQAARRIGS